MPKYGLLEISEDDLFILKQLEKDANIQHYLLGIRDKTNPAEIQQALIKLMELQFEIATAEKTPEHIHTAEGLNKALGIFISSIYQDTSPRIDALTLIKNLSQHLRTLRSKELDHAKEIALLHIEDLLNVGLILEAQQAFKNINLSSFNTEQQSTLEVVSQQLELIVKKTPKEKQEKAPLLALKNTTGDLKEQVRPFEAAGRISAPIKLLAQINILFSLAQYATHLETRHEALTQLWAFFKTLEAKPKISSDYKESIKRNPQRLAFFNIMEQLSKQPNSENRELMFVNYFLNSNLSERDRALAAPVLLVHLNIEQILSSLNLVLTLTPDNMKKQVVRNSVQLILQMIIADNLGQKIPHGIVHTPVFEEFINKIPPELSMQVKHSIERAIEDPSRNPENIENIIKIPQSKKTAMFSIENFLKEELPTLDPQSPRYKTILANVADSLFLTHASLFLRLRPGDFYDSSWRKHPEESNVQKLIDSNNNISEFVKSQIENAPDLASKRKIALFFADLMAYMVKQETPDFHGAAGIAWGLVTIPDKWLELKEDPKFRKKFENAQEPAKFLTEINYTRYRQIEHDARAESKMHIPLFGVMLKDLEPLDVNIDRNFPFWVTAKGKHYQYINSLHSRFMDYFRMKHPAMIVDVTKMAVSIVSSAPPRLEETSAVSRESSAAPLPSKTSQAGITSAPAAFSRAKPKPMAKREPTSSQEGSATAPAAFLRAKHAEVKRESGLRNEPILSAARTKQPSATLSQEREKMESKVKPRDNRRAGIRTSGDRKKLFSGERVSTPQESAKAADNPSESKKPPRKGTGPQQ